MVRFFPGRKKLIGILYLSYKLRERERERIRRDRQRGGETERKGRDREGEMVSLWQGTVTVAA